MLDQSILDIKNQKFKSVDLLRGLAILMVILVHTSQKISGDMHLLYYGQMGVQMFFIASAFTLCHSFNVRKSADEPLLFFYIRRFFRIAPGYYAGLLIYLLIFCTKLDIVSSWKGDYSLINIMVNILFLNGLVPSANNTIVPGGWSIGTEMLFYLIFPLLYKGYGVLQSKFKYSYLVIPVIALIVSVAAQYIFYEITSNPNCFTNNSFIYFSILNQLPVFCIGMSLYFAYQRRSIDKINIVTCLVLIISLSYLSKYLMFMGNSVFTLVNAITPVLAALSFAFLFILLQNKNIKSRLLENIGIRSYSCYLLHFIFAHFMTGFLSKKFEYLPANVNFILFYLLTVTFTYLLSMLMYKYVELKGIALGKNLILSVRRRTKESQIQANVR